jgi:hypothetical protein
MDVIQDWLRWYGRRTGLSYELVTTEADDPERSEWSPFDPRQV